MTTVTQLDSVHNFLKAGMQNRRKGVTITQMNALQQAIQAWIDAEPGRSRRALAVRSGLSPSVLDALMARPGFKSSPRTKTLRGLARGLSIPLDHILELAGVSAGLVKEERDEVVEGRLLQSALDELPEQMRGEVADLVIRVVHVVRKASDL